MLGKENNPIKLKILVIGSSFVGKSTLLRRFIDDEFDESINPTIGVDFKTKNIEINKVHVCLKLWDTAGSEKFQSLTPSYYRNAQGVILVYDVTRKQTFEDLQKWLDECNVYLDQNDCVKILVGNKIDLIEQRLIHRNDGIQFARAHSMLFIESSAKTSEGVSLAFEELVMKILDKPQLYSNQISDPRNKSTNLLDTTANDAGGFTYYGSCCY
ncbi:hypothetical protein GJ496_003718 [Pomphorhynchus laevis]|nr:hypothetical protein GJ496_003718 [Pomphorhynchus laevis]